MSKKALIVIDVQQIFFSDKKFIPYKINEVVGNINKMIKNARENDVPIIFVRHSDDYMKFGTEIWQVYEGLDVAEKDHFVDKKTPDSFFETDLLDILKRENIGEIYLCGLQTDYCVDTTCRSAFSKKIKAFLVEDAHTTYDTEFVKAENIIKHHNGIIGNWFAKLIRTSEVDFS